MTVAAAITLAVLASVFAALAFSRVSPDALLVLAVVALLGAGVLSPAEALAGFANTGLITVGALFIVAAGLRDTGAVYRITGALLGQPRTQRAGLMRLVGPVMFASSVLNNTPIVATLLPAITDWARRSRMPPSRFLMPLSFAAVLGGTCTLIGTSTNLVVYGLVEQSLASRPDLHLPGFVEQAWLGLPVALLGGIYLVLLGPVLLPDRSPVISLTDDPRAYTVELLVAHQSPLAGQSIEAAGLRALPGVYLAEIDRQGRIFTAVSPTERLVEGDRLIFVGNVDSVVDLQRRPGLMPAPDQVFKLDAPREERVLIEAVVSSTNPLIGQTIKAGRFRAIYNAVVVAVARHGERVSGKLGDVALREGDVLLLEASPDFVQAQRDSRDFYLVSQIDHSTPLRHDKWWIALVIMLVMVGSAASGLVPMVTASLVGAVVMVALGCVSVVEARASIDLQVLVAIAAAFGLGRAIVASGLDQLVASSVLTLGGDNPLIALALVYALTVLMTELITNNAAATLMFPFALAVSATLNVSPMPFVFAIMMGASASFLTPIGYQTNLMVYGPGGYQFLDFTRFGAPLAVMVGAVTLAVAPWVWPF